MKIYFARHGESEANVLRQISNRGLTHPLTRKGRQQVAALAQRLEGMGITWVYSSPVLRALETSVLLANHLDADLAVTGGLREYDCGILEGRADNEGWKLFRELRDGWLAHQRYDQRLEGGESFYDIRDRFVPLIEQIIRRHAGRAENVVCVAHGGVYCLMLPLVLGNLSPTYLPEHGFDNTACLIAELGDQGLAFSGWL